MKTGNFWKESYEGCMNWSQGDETYSIIQTETIKWIIDPRLKIHDSSLDDDDELPNDEMYLTIYGSCLYSCDVVEESPTNWFIDVEFDVLVHFKSGQFSKKVVRRFDNKALRHKLGKFIKVRKFASAKLPSGSELLIETKLRIKSYFGVYLSEFSIPRNIDSEVVCCLDGHILYIDKYPLACFSPVFREKLSLLKDDDVLGIDSIEYSDFLNFLRILYKTPKQEIKAQNVHGLLSAASLFDFGFCISECEDFIISTKELSIGYKLYLSSKYRLPRVQAEMIDDITIDEIEQVFEELDLFDGSNINELKVNDSWKQLNCLARFVLQAPKEAVESMINKIVIKTYKRVIG